MNKSAMALETISDAGIFDLDDIFACVHTAFVLSETVVQETGAFAHRKGIHVRISPIRNIQFGIEYIPPEQLS